MKITFYVFLSVASIGSAYFAWAYNKVVKQEKVVGEFSHFVEQSNIDTSIQVLLGQYSTNTQIAVAIINNKETNYYGYIKKEDGVEKIINQNSIFEIGSITKTFTSSLAAVCYKKGLLQPTTTLKEVLSFKMPDDVSAITLLQLSNHTSGLARLPENMKMPDPTNPYADYDTTQLFGFLKRAKLESASGKKYSYSNLGAALLGVICSNALNMSYEKALQQYILVPLQMQQTTTNLTEVQKQFLVKGLDVEGNETSNWDFDCMAGAGAIKSTVASMVLYAKANLDTTNMLYNSCHKESFKVNAQMSLGMGWHIIHDKSGEEILFHNGGTGGYTSCLMLNVKKQKAVIVLTNISAFNSKMGLIDALCAKLLKK